MMEDPQFLELLSKASQCMQRGDAQGAQPALEAGLRLQPQSVLARNLWGHALFRLGQLEDAQSTFLALSQAHPNQPVLRLNHALVMLRRGGLEEAKKEIHQLAVDHPQHAAVLAYAQALKGSLPTPVETQDAVGQRPNTLLNAPQAPERPIRMEFAAGTAPQLAWAQGMGQSPRGEDSNSAQPVDAAPQADEGTQEQLPTVEFAEPLLPFHLDLVTAAGGLEAPGPPAPQPEDHRELAPPSASAAPVGLALEPLPPQAAPSWDPSPTNSMVTALAQEPLTGSQWLVQKSIPPTLRPFSPVAPGLLGLSVNGEVLVRARAVAAMQGDVVTQPVTRPGSLAGGDLVGPENDPVIACTGTGHISLTVGPWRVAVLKVEGPQVVVLETALFGSSSGLTLEHHLLPMDARDKPVHALRFGGTGVVALRSTSSVRAVPCERTAPLRVAVEHLLAFEGTLTCTLAAPVAGLSRLALPAAVILQGQGMVMLRTGNAG